MSFFEGLIGVDEAKGLLINDPSLLGRSLDKPLKPRLAEAQEAGIPIDSGLLMRMGMYTEERWSTSIAYQKKRLWLSRGGLL